MTSLFLKIIFLIASLSGLYLSTHINEKLGRVCRKGEKCDRVIGSSYGRILGVRLSTFGVVYFFMLAVFIFSIIVFPVLTSFVLGYGIVPVVSIGVLFSFYLFFVQAVLLKTFCKYCMTQFFISIFLGLITLIFPL